MCVCVCAFFSRCLFGLPKSPTLGRTCRSIGYLFDYGVLLFVCLFDCLLVLACLHVCFVLYLLLSLFLAFFL